MIHVIQQIYQFLLPPGGIILLFLLYIFYEKKHTGKWNRILAGLVFLLYFLSTGVGANILAKPLESAYGPSGKIDGDVLLMMCSGANQHVPDVDGIGSPAPSMAKSMITTAQLYHKTGLPILICGGGSNNHIIKEAEIAERDLINIGIPAEKIYIEKNSRNTVEGAKEASAILKEHGWNHPILLAAALHTPRSLLAFKREGIDVTPYPTYYRRFPKSTSFSLASLIPSSGDLDDSAMAIREYLGLAAICLGLQ